jgi:hypothetical protein
MQNNPSNHLDKLDKVIRILNDCNFKNEAKELETKIDESFTSTELCLKCGSLLSKYIRNQKIEQVIGKEINDFIHYCSINGINITP